MFLSYCEFMIALFEGKLWYTLLFTSGYQKQCLVLEILSLINS